LLAVWPAAKPAAVSPTVIADELHVWSTFDHAADHRKVAAGCSQSGPGRHVVVAAID
jgi:hypothetical protein